MGGLESMDSMDMPLTPASFAGLDHKAIIKNFSSLQTSTDSNLVIPQPMSVRTCLDMSVLHVGANMAACFSCQKTCVFLPRLGCLSSCWTNLFIFLLYIFIASFGFTLNVLRSLSFILLISLSIFQNPKLPCELNAAWLVGSCPLAGW